MTEKDTTAETPAEAPEAEVTVTTEDPRITKANREAAEYRKQLRAVQSDLEKLRKAQMTEAEKLVAEAETRGRTSALTEIGQRLVRAEFRAQAAGRVDGLDDLLDDLNLAKFIGEDGEPDVKAIAARVARLAPPPPAEDPRAPGPRPDLSQGGSRNNLALNSDALTDALKAAVGAP